jgi:hypothetical protein
MSEYYLNWIALVLFLIALIHTFLTAHVAMLAHRFPSHKDLFHLLSEVEIVFGLWAFILVLFMFLYQGKQPTLSYLENRNFSEALFVFVVMVVSASRPIMAVITKLALQIVKLGRKTYQSVLLLWCLVGIIPLLGSFITEPAAMTVAALLLNQFLFSSLSNRAKYTTLATLFVNVSIGGTLTAYAAPPILIVASSWGWDNLFVFSHFGYKALIAITINTTLLCFFLRKELKSLKSASMNFVSPKEIFSWWVSLIHFIFLIGVVMFAHHPIIFVGLFLLFLGFTQAYQVYQTPLLLREALLVSFFLGGLVVLGGLQSWWLSPILSSLSNSLLFLGALVMTAFTDNAAITYLGSLVQNTDLSFKIALVSGAVIGGGLTVIANAPNPIGFSILKGHFPDQSILASRLAWAALPPTIIAAACFWFI